VDEMPLSKSINNLVGGKSTLQNEILGDLQQEFTSAPEKVKKFLLKNSAQRWEAASGVPLVNAVRVLFLVSLEGKCLVVSTRRLSRPILGKPGSL
jgi:hypothetical protein